MRRWTVALCALAATLSAQSHDLRAEEANTHAERPSGPLPQTCEAPANKDSILTIRIQLTADAFKRVVFDHPKPDAALPAGVTGQSIICTCVDAVGNIKDAVKLVRASGSPQLDTEAVEVGKTLVYPADHPGCMHDTVNFAGP
jgi:outer membrane biosynthesis protein TonB